MTVAWFHLSISAIGVPTILLLPRTTALAPEMVAPERRIRSRQPAGVQGRKPGGSKRC